MSKTETAAKSKTITFSYRSPTKKVKSEDVTDGEIPRIISQDLTFESKREDNGGLIRDIPKDQYVKVDEEFYDNLDKNKYPFSSKYVPMKHKDGNTEVSTNPIINQTSLLLHNLQDYKNVNSESEYKWGNESNQIVDSLKKWRKLYKILDNKKRQLKKVQNQKNSTTSFKDDGINNNSSNDSSNGNDDSEEGSSDNNNGNGSRRDNNKRRKLSNGENESDHVDGSDHNGMNGYSSNERKTRSTRSTK